MLLTDAVNAGFEFGSSALLCINVSKLWKAKMVRGVSLWPAAFFNTWGFWNLYWYPSLGQYISFTGGVLVLVVNTTWLALAWRYRKN